MCVCVCVCLGFGRELGSCAGICTLLKTSQMVGDRARNDLTGFSMRYVVAMERLVV